MSRPGVLGIDAPECQQTPIQACDFNGLVRAVNGFIGKSAFAPASAHALVSLDSTVIDRDILSTALKDTRLQMSPAVF